MSQDYLELGLDIKSFSNDKLTQLNNFIAAFDSLSAYDGKTINPIMGSGLVEFNDSVKKTSQLLGELNAKLAALDTNTKKVSASTESAAKGTKKLTEEEAKLKAEIEAHNKAVMEQARLNTDAGKAAKKKSDDEAKAAKISRQNAQDDKTLNKEIAKEEKARIAEEKRLKKESADVEKKRIAEEKRLKKEQAAEDKRLANEKKKRDKDLADQAKVNAKNISDAEKQRKKATDDAAKATKEQAKADAEAAKEAENLGNKYKQLQLLLKQRQQAYANALVNTGPNSEETRRALAEVQETQSTMNAINENMGNTAGQASKFGRALTSAFGVLRNMAYVLPGLGIAGIFNLAFEAIGDMISSLNLFTSEASKLRDLEIKTNGLYKERIDAIKELTEKYKELVKIQTTSPETKEKKLGIAAAYGISPNEQIDQEIKIAQQKFDDAQKKLINGFKTENIDEVNKKIKDLFGKLAVSEQELNQLRNIQQHMNEMASGLKPDAKFGGGPGKRTGYEFYTQEMMQAEVDRYQSRLDIQKAGYEIAKQTAEDYVETQAELNTKIGEQDKLLYDQRLNQQREFSRSAISVNQKTNEDILSDDIKSYDEKNQAIDALKKDAEKLAEIDYMEVKTSRTASPDEKAIAYRNYQDELLKIDIEYDAKHLKLNEEYNQRFFTATEKINSETIQAEATEAERIFRNETKSLEERLKAYEIYIKKRQELEDVQLIRNLQNRALMAPGPVPQAEIDAEMANRNNQRREAQADAEKEIYDIVSQSLADELEIIKLANYDATRENQHQYTEELKALNESFEKKLISAEKYKDERLKIDRKYRNETLDEAIVDDKKDLQRLLDREAILAKQQKKAEGELGKAGYQHELTTRFANPDEQLVSERNVNKAKGNLNAIVDARKKNKKEIETVQKRLDDDELKRQQTNYELNIENEEKRLKRRRAIIAMLGNIEDSLYRVIKDAADKEYQYKLNKLNEEKALIDARYNYEIEAVQRSSLAQKDKFALEVQLNARRVEADKKAKREEMKLAHDKAVFDKALTMSHIVLNTAEAVAQSLPVVPLAIAAGVAGAAELAIASNVRIPQYRTGVKGKPNSGLALTGEAGPELIKEPYKSPYLVYKENVSWLPKGTDVVPLKEDNGMLSPIKDDGWEKTMWLAKQLKPKDKKVNVVNNITIDLGFETYKKSIIGN